MTHEHQEAGLYRMPYGFGPTPGPRQEPPGKRFDWSKVGRWSAAVSYLTEREKLDKLLPPRFSLVGDPIVTVEFHTLSNLDWLAGRSYSMLQVRFPAAYDGQRDQVAGSFLSVLWENLADPVISGREELGFAKLWCELPPPEVTNDTISCKASWLGHEFAVLELTGLTETSPRIPAYPGLGDRNNDGTLHYKYMPQTEKWGQEAIAHACLSPVVASAQADRVLVGKGRVSFRKTNWEDMPTQYHIIQKLAELPVLEEREAWCVEARGGSNLSQQRVLL
jgi:hypothetical protein